jgi:hypothetical protein
MENKELVPVELGESVAWEHAHVEKQRHPRQDVGFGLYAVRPVASGLPVIPAGAVVYRVVARNQALAHGKATRGSLQLGSDVHVASEGWTWAFLNHSCSPNVRLHSVHIVRAGDTGLASEVDFTLTALEDISEGQELTFNYLTTEDSMAAPFACACGAASCFRTIRGLAHADTSDAGRLRALEPLVAPHLAALLQTKIVQAEERQATASVF